jgi:hypothetical protein
MRCFLIGSAVFLLSVALAGAEGELIGENLVAKIPSGYKLGFEQEADQAKMMEFIPEGESVEDWSEMITIQLFDPSNKNAEFYTRLESLLKQACEDGSTHVIPATEENGYPIKVFQMFCPTNLKTGMGEVTFIKTIEGKDKFYVVQKAWRTEKYSDDIPLTEEDFGTWIRYLKDVYVCDSRVETRKCTLTN